MIKITNTIIKVNKIKTARADILKAKKNCIKKKYNNGVNKTLKSWNF